MELIDRDKLIEKAYFHGNLPDPGNLYPDCKEAVDVDDIESAPTVDAIEVVHSRWLPTTYMIPSVMCAKCSYPVGKEYEKEFKYCPNCGAKMDGDGNGY